MLAAIVQIVRKYAVYSTSEFRIAFFFTSNLAQSQKYKRVFYVSKCSFVDRITKKKTVPL